MESQENKTFAEMLGEDLPKFREMGVIKPILYCNNCKKEIRNSIDKQEYEQCEKTGRCLKCKDKQDEKT